MSIFDRLENYISNKLGTEIYLVLDGQIDYAVDQVLDLSMKDENKWILIKGSWEKLPQFGLEEQNGTMNFDDYNVGQLAYQQALRIPASGLPRVITANDRIVCINDGKNYNILKPITKYAQNVLVSYQLIIKETFPQRN